MDAFRTLALLTHDFVPDSGGVQTYLYETIRRQTQYTQVVVLTPVPGDLPATEPVRKVVLPHGNSLVMIRALRQFSPDDVLVGHTHPQLLLAAALQPMRQFGAIAHGNDFLAAQRRWHRPLFNRLLARARPLVANSQTNASRLQRLGFPGPHVVYPGTDPHRFVPPTEPPPPPLRLLTVARLVPRKGVDTVLHALPALLAALPALQYDIVGGGPDRSRLETMANDLGVASAVYFHGRVPEDELPDVYQKAHIFVMPAREEKETASVEGFGIVYLEAAASGLPVVAGRSGGAVEAVRNGETGFLVTPEDVDALSETLFRLLTDAELRRRLGGNGRRWVESEMNWDRAARQLADLLDG